MDDGDEGLSATSPPPALAGASIVVTLSCFFPSPPFSSVLRSSLRLRTISAGFLDDLPKIPFILTVEKEEDVKDGRTDGRARMLRGRRVARLI
jgi:hypothetical protein